MPDIKFFDATANFGHFFARYDYMGVKPTLMACEGFLAFCNSCRSNGLKLHRNHLEDEKRAYITIKDSDYVTTKYNWER